MRLVHSEGVLDWEGKPVLGQDSKPQTFRDLAVVCLNTFVQDEKLGSEMKARCFLISSKLYKRNKTVDLTVDELALIKERAGVILMPLAYGRICDWLEGNPQILEIEDEDEPEEPEG